MADVDKYPDEEDTINEEDDSMVDVDEDPVTGDALFLLFLTVPPPLTFLDLVLPLPSPPSLVVPLPLFLFAALALDTSFICSSSPKLRTSILAWRWRLSPDVHASDWLVSDCPSTSFLIASILYLDGFCVCSLISFVASSSLISSSLIGFGFSSSSLVAAASVGGSFSTLPAVEVASWDSDLEIVVLVDAVSPVQEAVCLMCDTVCLVLEADSPV